MAFIGPLNSTIPAAPRIMKPKASARNSESKLVFQRTASAFLRVSGFKGIVGDLDRRCQGGSSLSLCVNALVQGLAGGVVSGEVAG